jgi:protein KIBRA
MMEVEMNVETVDAETNTECAFLPERAKAKLRDRTGSTSLLLRNTESGTTLDDRLVKRSQTFSPSAVVNKSRYMCRRSDSDSAMHFGTLAQPHPFRRGAVERRSLRYHSKVQRVIPSEF